MKVKVDFLDQIEVNLFPYTRSAAPVIMIIGGVHGNEIPGIHEVELLWDHLKKPESELTQLILEAIVIVVIPLFLLRKCAGIQQDEEDVPKTISQELNWKMSK